PLVPTYQFRVNPTPVSPLGVGPNLDYSVYFVDSATRTPLPGVQVRFAQRSGIAVDPSDHHTVSDGFGAVHFPWTTGQDGGFSGDLTIQAPSAGAATIIGGVALTTFDADSGIIFARWAVGRTGSLYAIPAYGPVPTRIPAP